MGTACTLRCPDCNHEVHLTIGGGFLSNPSNPETRRDVLAGNYGSRPKAVLESNPDADCSWYYALFHCSCGHYVSKETVWISSTDGDLYSPSKQCPLCHRKMWEVQDITQPMPCPECGSLMVESDHILWD